MKKAKASLFLAAACLTAVLAGCDISAAAPKLEAVYLGVENYGAEETNKDNKNSFKYLFETDGRTVSLSMLNGTPDEEGNYDYPIQNALKEGYSYLLTVNDGTVTGVSEIKEENAEGYTPAVA